MSNRATQSPDYWGSRFTLDETMQTEEGTIEQHFSVTPTKERKEMLTASGDGVVQIFRYDNKTMLQRHAVRKDVHGAFP